MKIRIPGPAAALLAGVLCVPALQAEDSRWSLSPRAGMSVSGGVPANDMINYGLAARFRLDTNEYVGATVEVLDFDFEKPWDIVGVRQDKAVEADDIDAAASTTVISVFYQRGYGSEHAGWNGYWTAGLGIGLVDVKDVRGPAVGGSGQFDITTDPGSEWFPSVGVGVRYHFTPRLSADFGVTANHHFADWKVTDRESGNEASVDNYTRYAAQLGMSWAF